MNMQLFLFLVTIHRYSIYIAFYISLLVHNEYHEQWITSLRHLFIDVLINSFEVLFFIGMTLLDVKLWISLNLELVFFMICPRMWLIFAN